MKYLATYIREDFLNKMFIMTLLWTLIDSYYNFDKFIDKLDCF